MSYWTLPYFPPPHWLVGYPWMIQDCWTYKGKMAHTGKGWIAPLLFGEMHGTFAGVTLQRGYHKDPSIDSPNPHSGPPKPGPPCPCAVFRLADATYHDLSAAQKQAWRNAVKRPGRSGYMVWMKEAMVCLFRYGVYPEFDNPSASGGYSCNALNPDFTAPGSNPTIGAAPYNPPPPPPGEDCPCYICDPPLPCTLYATCTGFEGDFEFFNNPDGPRHVLEWRAPCKWVAHNLPGGPHTSSLMLSYGTTVRVWMALATVKFHCWMRLRVATEGHPCRAEGEPFWWYQCNDVNCNNGRSCLDSRSTAKFMLYRTP